jgi:hypothetical protein
VSGLPTLSIRLRYGVIILTPFCRFQFFGIQNDPGNPMNLDNLSL